MPSIRSEQIRDGQVKRADLHTSTTGNAVMAKAVAGAGIDLSSTGADAGTGDVTIALQGVRARVTSTLTTTSTTAVSITGLTWTQGASEDWYFRAQLFTTVAAGVNGIRFAITAPAGSTIQWGVAGTGGSLTSSQYEDSTSLATLTTNNWNSVAFNGNVQIFGVVHTAGTSGAVQLQYAAVLNTSLVTIYADSFLLASKF